MRIAITADLHWGQNRVGDEATSNLVEFLRDAPPDALILGGDQGTQQHFEECLALFADLNCPKALVPGNHDLWVEENDPRGDSMNVYDHHLPDICLRSGFHYLDQGPVVLSSDLALVGSINWYDYSWSIARIQTEYPGEEWRLRNKTFTRGRHNDARFVRWPYDDQEFTNRVVANFSAHLDDALRHADKVIAVTHHPPVYGLNFPRANPPENLDALLWDAFCGNEAIEQLLTKHTDRVAFVFCGHTHRECEGQHGQMRCYNIGGDYHFKRLLLLDWPSGNLDARTFGNPERRT